MNEIDSNYTDEIVCPYCGYEFSDSWEFAENNPLEWNEDIECRECGLQFNCQCHATITYSTKIKEKNK